MIPHLLSRCIKIPDSLISTRAWEKDKHINNEKSPNVTLYFTHLPRNPPWTDCHQIGRVGCSGTSSTVPNFSTVDSMVSILFNAIKLRSRLFFKTKTKTLKFFQDQDQDQDFLWCILEADRKAFFIFGHKRKCRRKWNSIYGRKRNECENGHSFSVEKRKCKSPNNRPISVFVLFIHSVTKSALQCAANRYLVQFRLFCRWFLLTGFHFPHVQCIDIFVAFF